MEDKKTIFSYISQVFATYGVILFIFIILGITIGDSVREHSSLFELGNQGYSISTLLQLFIFAVIVSVSQIAFLTDKWINKLSFFYRNVLFFGSITVFVIMFAILFHWFPIDDIGAWTGFILSFAICTTIGVIITRLKEQAENRKMEQALDKFKREK